MQNFFLACRSLETGKSPSELSYAAHNFCDVDVWAKSWEMKAFAEARSRTLRIVLMQLAKCQTFVVGGALGDLAIVFGLLKI